MRLFIQNILQKYNKNKLTIRMTDQTSEGWWWCLIGLPIEGPHGRRNIFCHWLWWKCDQQSTCKYFDTQVNDDGKF